MYTLDVDKNDCVNAKKTHAEKQIRRAGNEMAINVRFGRCVQLQRDNAILAWSFD